MTAKSQGAADPLIGLLVDRGIADPDGRRLKESFLMPVLQSDCITCALKRACMRAAENRDECSIVMGWSIKLIHAALKQCNEVKADAFIESLPHHGIHMHDVPKKEYDRLLREKIGV